MYIQTKYRIAEESQIWCSSFALPIIQPFRVQQNPIKIWDLQNPAIKKKEPRGPKTISSNCAVVFVNPSIWILGQVVASAAPSNGKADAQPGQARQAKSRIKGGSALHKPMFSKSTFLQLNLFLEKMENWWNFPFPLKEKTPTKPQISVTRHPGMPTSEP